MTKEEAIKILRHWGSNTPATDRDCAVKMAIEALENPEPHWIPVAERLPEKEGRYLVTNSKIGAWHVDIDFYRPYMGGWMYGQGVTAWMPLPEPYKGVTS